MAHSVTTEDAKKLQFSGGIRRASIDMPEAEGRVLLQAIEAMRDDGWPTSGSIFQWKRKNGKRRLEAHIAADDEARLRHFLKGDTGSNVSGDGADWVLNTVCKRVRAQLR